MAEGWADPGESAGVDFRCSFPSVADRPGWLVFSVRISFWARRENHFPYSSRVGTVPPVASCRIRCWSCSRAQSRCHPNHKSTLEIPWRRSSLNFRDIVAVSSGVGFEPLCAPVHRAQPAFPSERKNSAILASDSGLGAQFSVGAIAFFHAFHDLWRCWAPLQLVEQLSFIPAQKVQIRVLVEPVCELL